MRTDAIALIPAYSHVDHRLSNALRDAELTSVVIHGCSDLVRARCHLLSAALRTPAETFVFIDADMIPSPDQIVALISNERLADTNAVTGAYAVGKGEVAASSMAGKTIQLPTPERYAACLVAGLGFAAVKRSSVERIVDALPTVHDPNGTAWSPAFLPMLKGDSHEYLSEDYSFWWRLREYAGVQLWLDSALVVGHCKPTIVMPKGAA